MTELSPGALAGTRVIDMTRILSGPYCTQMLGDHGADIVKIEPPDGDETRGWGPPFRDGTASYFLGVNRSKRAIALDLSKPSGREVLLKLLAGADILIENFKPGQLEKWGLGYDEVLAKRFPRLIVCRISGFGADGPLGGYPGYDAVIQGMAGLNSVNGEADGPGVRMGIPMVDIATGMNATIGILMALAERSRSGKGQALEVTLYDSAIALQHPHLANYFLSGKPPARTGNAHTNIYPYDAFPTKTKPLFVAIGNDRQFARLVEEVGRKELASDPRFRTNTDRNANRPALRAELAPALAQVDGLVLAEKLLGLGVPAGPVLDVPDVIAHPHTAHRNMVVEKDGYRGFGTPVKFQRTPGGARGVPPRLGQHTREILAEAGYSPGEIDALVADRIAIDAAPKKAAE
jgi:crotonobetainyl-CoA:carnitine CoA-transferase CaiB-like acyl-CoA transferase